MKCNLIIKICSLMAHIASMHLCIFHALIPLLLLLLLLLLCKISQDIYKLV